MKSILKVTIIVLVASLILIGCAQQAVDTNSSQAQTAIANTVVAMQTQMVALSTEPTSAATVAAPTATTAPTIAIVPTETQAPTQAPSPTKKPASTTPIGPTYRVGHVTDLNFPDGTYSNVGLHFTKQWSITNIGTGTWQSDFKVVYVDDNPLQAPAYVEIGQVVSPGQSVTIKIPLITPETVDTYRAEFMLQTPDGKLFGIGNNFDQPFWVEIISH